MTQFAIYEGHMEDLRKKVQKIQRKCKKLGCEFHYAEVGEEFKNIKMADGNEVTFRFVVVEAEGIAKVNGWEFVGSIEHTNAGNIIRKAVVDAVIPERYRTSDTYCEHCRTQRRRNDVYLVMNEAGEFKQVGKNCLKDFTNGMDAKMVAEMASLRSIFEQYERAEEFDNWENGFLSYRTYIPTKTVLAYAWETVRGYGYKKADEIGSTKGRVIEYYKVRNGLVHYIREAMEDIEAEMEAIHFNPEADEVAENVEKMMAWVREQRADTDYMNNLTVAVNNEYCDYRRFGILCSLIPVYCRAMNRAEQEKTERKEAGYVGAVGDRLTVEIKSGRCVASWNTDFGTTFLYKFTDAEGNVFMWKTGKYIDEERVTELVGTVKAQEEYNGVKQNVMTRCKVA